MVRNVAEVRSERRSVVVEVHEQKSGPGLEPHRLQAVIVSEKPGALRIPGALARRPPVV